MKFFDEIPPQPMQSARDNKFVFAQLRSIIRIAEPNRKPPLLSRFWPCALIFFACSLARGGTPSTAIFYGYPVPVAALSHFDRVVIEAENLPDPAVFGTTGPLLFAYVSVGEAEGWRSSTSALDGKLFLGNNTEWGSRIADLTQPNWTAFLIDKRMAALWRQGYRAFFLDTLDSYKISIKDAQGQALQLRALVDIVRAIHLRFPGVKLLLNRGFEALPEIGHLAAGLVAESLFQGWDASKGVYVKVDESDRRWLLAQLQTATTRYGLPITVIDYVSPQEPELISDTTIRIRALGFAAWVATPSLDTLSIGQEK